MWRHPRYSSTDNASSIVYRGHVLPKNPFNPFFSRRETVFQKFFTFFMNSSPFLSSSQRKIGKNRTSLSKHYYLSLRRFLLLYLRPWFSSRIEQALEKETWHCLIPFSMTPPSYAVCKHLTWFDPRSGHIRLPTAVGKSATSVEMVIYIRGSPEGESAADEIGRVLRSSRFVSSPSSPFPLCVHAHVYNRHTHTYTPILRNGIVVKM